MAVLDTKETWTKVLQLIPDDEIRRELDSEWDDDPSLSSTDKWEKLISKLAWKEKEKKVISLCAFSLSLP